MMGKQGARRLALRFGRYALHLAIGSTLRRPRAASYADSVRGEDRVSDARMAPRWPSRDRRNMQSRRDGEFDMDDSQRRRFRDFVIFVIVAVFLLGFAVVSIARAPTPEVLIAFAPIEASFVIVAYQVRPRPMDRRVLVPIETGCLLLLAAIVASNLIFALGGDRYIAASIILITLAVTVMVVRWQVLEIIGPKPAPSMLGSRSKIR